MLDAFRGASFWSYLAWHDIRIRYRHSRIGPFWITLSTAIFCLAIALVFSRLFNAEVAELLPFVAIGSVLWGFISGVIGYMPNAYVANAGYVKNMRINLITILLRAICGELIVLLHHLLIVVAIYIYYGIWPGWAGLMAVPGLLLVSLNLLSVGITLSLLGARYRDVAQMTQSVLQVAIFVTPIFWLPRLVPEGHWILVLNPFVHLLDLVRSPLLGSLPKLTSWFAGLGMLAVTAGIAALAYRIGRNRVALWV